MHRAALSSVWSGEGQGCGHRGFALVLSLGAGRKMSESPLLFCLELGFAAAAQPTPVTHWSLLSRGLPSRAA